MDNAELRDLLDDHADVLRARGFDVRAVDVAPPATSEEVDIVEASLGLVLPASSRSALTTLSAKIDWSWWTDRRFPPPYDGIFSGELRWSLDTLVEIQVDYRGWVDACFSNPDDPYDVVWHNKLAFLQVPNGDQFAIDLDPASAGAVVYLSHDDGEGHGYVLADSLADLVDRWAPLACPGSEDWQWLPFVPWDEGPIDPTCPTARGWIELIGLRDDPPRTHPVAPSTEHIDGLLQQFRGSPASNEGRHAGRRALKCCGPDRFEDVLELLGSNDPGLQEIAAKLLGEWKRRDAVPALTETARRGTRNGRLAAIAALRRIPGPEAAAAIMALRSELGEDWVPNPR